MASIRKRGPFQYQATVRRQGYDPQTKTFADRRDAVAWAASIECEMHSGAFSSRVVADTTTLRALIDRYREAVTPGHKGAESENLRLRMLARCSLGQRIVATLRPSDFASYRDARLKIRKPATVVRELALFSVVLTKAIREWDVNIVHPLTNVSRPKVRNERKRLLSPAEECSLLAELAPRTRNELGQLAPGGTLCPWARPIVQIAIETAMRRSEILSLEWRNVLLEERILVLPDTKNGHEREVPLSSTAIKLLSELPRSPEEGRVFPVSVAALKKVYERAVERAGIADLTFHDLRRVGIARLAKRLDLLELATTTGHRQVNVLYQRYYSTKASQIAEKLR
ncbi:site-specific integrase [Hydrogenophaga sp.]|uniref:site-specific integrase n=1 Tax=Hydrogenophaga sp. TaxID=1904254 RepID=UPI0025C25AE3|nr:site-specific integrase [Hydrogenophaga sp.]